MRTLASHCTFETFPPNVDVVTQNSRGIYRTYVYKTSKDMLTRHAHVHKYKLSSARARAYAYVTVQIRLHTSRYCVFIFFLMFVVAGSSLFIVQSGSLRVTVEKEGACRQLATFEKGANARSLSVLARISKFLLSRMVGVHIRTLLVCPRTYFQIPAVSNGRCTYLHACEVDSGQHEIGRRR